MKLKILLFTLSAIVLFGCQSKKKTNNTEKNSFDTFYERFHTDSLYQMAHINFPLPGLPEHADTLSSPDNFRWQKDDWTMHRTIDLSEESGFKREFTVVSDDLVKETIYHTSGQFAMERRFAKLGDDWYLIYYGAMRQVGQGR